MNNIISRYKNVALGLLVGLLFGLTSCSDSHMEEVNTNDTKGSTIDPNSLLTTAQLQTYGDFGMMDTYRSYISGFTQQFAGGWNVTRYAGSVYPMNSQSCQVWDQVYRIGLNSLTLAIDDTQKKPNLNAAARIYRVYLFSILTDIYGDIPCSEACRSLKEGISNPRYDTQESVYNWFFEELKACEEQLGTGTDVITGDVTSLGGSTEMWKKFANSLRMRFAMRISDANPEKAKQEFVDAYNTNKYLKDAGEDAYVKYLDVPFTLYDGAKEYDFRANALGESWYGQDMESPSFICATMFEMLDETKDPRQYRICRYIYNAKRSEVKPDAENIDITDEMLKNVINTGKTEKYRCDMGTAWYDNSQAGLWDSLSINYFPSLVEKSKKDPTFKYTINNCHVRMKYPFLSTDFEKPECPGIIITSAEVQYLIAEAVSKGWITGDVKQYFEEGVKRSMQLLNNYYLRASLLIDNSEMTDYITALNADLSTPEKAREAINTQAWILHLTNPNEAWANLRRADYPVLKDRKNLPTFSAFSTGSDLSIPTRLPYPDAEFTSNESNFTEVINRPWLGGSDDWHKRLWWDVNDQHVK